MSEQLDTATFTGAHPTARDLVAQLEVWGFTRRPARRGTDGVHLAFRGPRGGTVRVLRSLMGRADAGVVAKAARLAGVDVAQFWAGPASEYDTGNGTGNDTVEADTVDVAGVGVVAELGARRGSATRDRIIALVLGVHTTADRPLGFDQVVALCPDVITRDQARSASAVLCRDGQLERIRSGVYQWADGVRARRPADPVPAPTRPVAAAVTSVPAPRPARPSTCPAAHLSPAELFERLFPHGVRMTAELLADFEQWAALTEKLTAYADAS
jgi:hypothetical protein